MADTTAHTTDADTMPSDVVVHSCTNLGETTLIVQLAGEIDHFSAGPLRVILASAAANGYTDLVLDSSRVSFCDSGFLNLMRWWPRNGRRLHLTARSPAVQRLLRAATAGQAFCGRPARHVVGQASPGTSRRVHQARWGAPT
ncbi:STAS domain-containing protein [Streptomyces hypolithicus]